MASIVFAETIEISSMYIAVFGGTLTFRAKKAAIVKRVVKDFGAFWTSAAVIARKIFFWNLAAWASPFRLFPAPAAPRT